MGEVTLKGYNCERCGHVWAPRENEQPKVCPKCKSPYWNTLRRRNLKTEMAKKLEKISREGLR